MNRPRSLYTFSLVFLALAAPASAQTWASFGPPTGEIGSVVVAPSRPSTILAIPGNDGGGLFRSSNGGASWQSISAGLCDVHVGGVAFHPTQPDTIYAATLSAGVCRTTNGGATWTAVASGLPVDSNGFHRLMDGIAVNPSTPSTLLAATIVGVYRSTDAGTTWLAAGLAGTRVRSVAISPSAPATAYLATDSGVYKSSDSGATWAVASTGLPSSFGSDGRGGQFEGSFTFDPGNANVVYLTAETVYKTSNSGSSWAPSNTGIGTPFFISAIAIDPANTSVLYVSAIGGCGWCKSTNGGGTWSVIPATGLPALSGLPNVIGTVAIDPVTPTRFYAGTTAGAYRSSDGGVTWIPINSGLAPLPIDALALTGGSPASAIAASRAEGGGSNLSKLTGGVPPFSPVGSPLAGDNGRLFSVIVDPTDAGIIYVLGGTGNNSACGRVYKTTDGGTSWTLMNSGILATLCGNSLTIDPASPSTLYLATVNPNFNGTGCCEIGLYKTTTGGATWSASNSGIFQNSVNRVSISPQRSNVLYAAAGESVYRSSNSGATWTGAGAGLPPNASNGSVRRNVARVAIDPTNDNIAYAATLTGVFRTADGGVSWTAKQSGWPTLNGVLYAAAALAIDPNTPTTIYASPSTPWPGPNPFVAISDARGAGLLKSIDSGATWFSAGAEIAGAIVNDVVFDGLRAMYASTNNGVFRFSTSNPPSVTLDRTALKFAATTNGTALISQTPAQTVRLTQGAGAPVTWTATPDKPWLTVTPASGSGSVALSVAVKFDATLAASGSVTGGITIALTGAVNAVDPVVVAMTVVPATAAASRPFGVFDTPVGDATVLAGSIALTGWTLDNVGVVRVEIWRDLQPGETTPPFASTADDPRRGKVFIANATFVDGARPDVEALNPTTPSAYRAGWGYLLLTRGLWNDGNGTYTLHAFAFDQENNVATIGSKTVIVSNNSAAKPFGSIDTPAIGGDASGPNFGWGLTPKVNGVATCKIQPSGVQYSIDSGPLQPVAYGDARADIAGAFPGFSNTTAAGGHAIIDWTALTNGPHTIGWLITDDCNRADGVGSRFFNVTTGTNLLAGDFRLKAEATGKENGSPLPLGDPVVSAFRRNSAEDEPAEAVLLTRGHGGELPAIVEPDAAGSRTIEVKQGERIELRLPRGFDAAHQLGPNGERRALPIGTTWDAGSGTFYWQPAAGFLGRYRIVFTDGTERISVRLVVVPQGEEKR